MKQKLVSRISISLLAIVMIVFGVYHFKEPQSLLEWVPGYLPGGIYWVYFVGAAFIVAGVSFIINWKVRYAGYLLACLLLIFILTIHLPNYLNGGSLEVQHEAFVNLLKDTAIAGFAIHIASNAER